MKEPDHRPGAVILGGGFVSLEAARNLHRHGVPVCVLAPGCSVARWSRVVGRFVRWPSELTDEGLPQFLAALAEEHGLQRWALFPTSDEQLRVLAQDHARLSEHFALTHPPWETVRHLYDKRLTDALARATGVPTPVTEVPGDAARIAAGAYEFPVVLKPAVTPHFVRVTNRKAYRADNRDDLRRLYQSMIRVIPPAEVIVQEYLPDPARNLCSFAGYFRQGEPVAGVSVRRTRQYPRDFGRSSSFVTAVELPELRELAARLLRPLRYTGLAEVEFMWNAKRARYELLEVNARLWAWHGLGAAAGLDFPYLAYADALGLELAPGPARPGVKWIRFITDARAAAEGIFAGELGVGEYLASLRGPKAHSVFSLSDPLPFLADPLLLLVDRFARALSRAKHGPPPPAPPDAPPGRGSR